MWFRIILLLSYNIGTYLSNDTLIIPLISTWINPTLKFCLANQSSNFQFLTWLVKGLWCNPQWLITEIQD